MNISMNQPGAFSVFVQKFGVNGMMKSTQEKLERQQQTQNQIDFFEKQKENLKNMECDNLEDISRKLEMFHSYEDQIAAVKQQYNNEQMWHVMDEAEERGEQIAKAAEENKPKTEEERKKDMQEEALGIDEEKGALTEELEDLVQLEDSDRLEEVKELTEETEQMQEEQQLAKEAEEMESAGQMEAVGQTTEEELQKEMFRYVPFDAYI